MRGLHCHFFGLVAVSSDKIYSMQTLANVVLDSLVIILRVVTMVFACKYLWSWEPSRASICRNGRSDYFGKKAAGAYRA